MDRDKPGHDDLPALCYHHPWVRNCCGSPSSAAASAATTLRKAIAGTPTNFAPRRCATSTPRGSRPSPTNLRFRGAPRCSTMYCGWTTSTSRKGRGDGAHQPGHQIVGMDRVHRTATRVNPVEVEDCAVASLVMRSWALFSLASTLGSQREISRLRLCFEHVTLESTHAPYSPGDDPWEIVPASPGAELQIAEALADYRPVPSRYEGQLAAYHAALTTGGPLPVTLADARSSLELVTALYHSSETGLVVSLPIAADHPSYDGWG